MSKKKDMVYSGGIATKRSWREFGQVLALRTWLNKSPFIKENGDHVLLSVRMRENKKVRLVKDNSK